MTVEHFDPKAVSIGLSDAAKKHFLNEIKLAGGMGIRFFTKRAGCSGWMYKSEIIFEKGDDDLEAYNDGEIKIFIQQKSAPYLNKVNIDFIQKELGQSQITYQNPNESARCGCGESFMVDSEKKNEG